MYTSDLLRLPTVYSSSSVPPSYVPVSGRPPRVHSARPVRGSPIGSSNFTGQSCAQLVISYLSRRSWQHIGIMRYRLLLALRGSPCMKAYSKPLSIMSVFCVGTIGKRALGSQLCTAIRSVIDIHTSIHIQIAGDPLDPLTIPHLTARPNTFTHLYHTRTRCSRLEVPCN